MILLSKLVIDPSSTIKEVSRSNVISNRCLVSTKKPESLKKQSNNALNRNKIEYLHLININNDWGLKKNNKAKDR